METKKEVVEITQPDVVQFILRNGGGNVGDWVRLQLKGPNGRMGMALKDHGKWFQIKRIEACDGQWGTCYRVGVSTDYKYVMYSVHADGWRREVE